MKNFFKNISKDLAAGQEFGRHSKISLFIFNRGVHALFIYRVANGLYRLRIPLMPILLSRLIQILYAIDIDYRAQINGGVVIVHGVGIVIGSGVRIEANVIIFHCVTLGRRGIGAVIAANDGFPNICEGVTICAGSMILGNITIGKNATIGANCTVTKDVAADHICKVADNLIIFKKGEKL